MLTTVLNPKNNKVFYLAVLILVLFGNTVSGQSQRIIEAETILKTIQKKKPIYLENITIEGDLDFTRLKANPESKTLSRVMISSPVYFQNCRFKGKIIGFAERNNVQVASSFESNLSFYNCTFFDEILLSGALVRTALVFELSKLHGELHLENTVIGHDANFSGVIFGRKVFFQNAVFRKNTYFNKSIFNEIAHFQSCKWEGEAIFRETEFRENADFSLQKTFSPMSFNFSNFKKAVFFEGSRFGDDFEIDHVSAERILLSGCQFWQKLHFDDLKSKEIHFTDAIFYKYFPDFSKIMNSEAFLEQSGIRYLGRLK